MTDEHDRLRHRQDEGIRHRRQRRRRQARIGAMTTERWKTFFDTMVAEGVYPPTSTSPRPILWRSSTRRMPSECGSSRDRSLRGRGRSPPHGPRPLFYHTTTQPGAVTFKPSPFRRSRREPLVTLSRIGKTYSNGTVALRDVDLEDRQRGVRQPAGAVRLRQEHDPAPDRGVRRSDSGRIEWAGGAVDARSRTISASSFRSRR